MYAAVINAVAVSIAAILGVMFQKKINGKYTGAILLGLAIVVAMIGVNFAIATEDTLGMIICIVIGIFIGEVLHIEDHLENFGDKLKKKVAAKSEGNSTFTQGFVTSTLLFCIGPMAIIGSLQAGTMGDPTIILSKTVIDCIAALSFAITLGLGVVFSGFSILIYQGLITLLAIWVSPYLGDAVITEMSAVGGVLMIGIAINLLELRDKKIRVGNMLPAVFLPILYQPLVSLLTSLF